LSRLATSFIPYARDIVGEISGKDYYAVALTDEVVAFADNIAMHPETWLDFPLAEEEDNDGKPQIKHVINPNEWVLSSDVYISDGFMERIFENISAL